MKKDAAISKCGQYRYILTRTWSDEPYLAFVMMNPSTADASEDDATIRRCIGFAKRESCGGIIVVNVCAYRTKSPDELFGASVDIVGPWNMGFIKPILRHRRRGLIHSIVAAWGADSRLHLYVRRMFAALPELKTSMFALHITKNGDPGHPLYLPKTAPLVRWTGDPVNRIVQ